MKYKFRRCLLFFSALATLRDKRRCRIVWLNKKSQCTRLPRLWTVSMALCRRRPTPPSSCSLAYLWLVCIVYVKFRASPNRPRHAHTHTHTYIYTLIHYIHTFADATPLRSDFDLLFSLTTFPAGCIVSFQVCRRSVVAF